MRVAKAIIALCMFVTSLAFASETIASERRAALVNHVSQDRYVREIADMEDPETREQTLCLALTLYHEIRGPHNNRAVAAVGWATRNRVDSPVAAGRNYCEIIFESGQYTWTRKSFSQAIPREREINEWHRMVRIAASVISGDVADPTNGANSFYLHARTTPSWAGPVAGRRIVGPHTFVRVRNR